MKEKYKMAGITTIGYCDIETSGLTADFDIILSYAILVRNVQTGKTSMRYGIVNSKDFEYARNKKDAKIIDRRVTQKLLDDISDLDCLIGHWFVGRHRHDMPFIRTRAAINQLRGVPKYKTIRYGDTQKWSSLLYRLHSNGLQSIANMFQINTKKTALEPHIWVNACIGVKSALDYILKHNLKDVIITYKVHKGIEEFVPIPSQLA